MQEKKFAVKINKSVRKEIHKIPFPWQERISNALIFLQNNPYLGEKLSGEFSGCFKIKIWPYRIIYSIIEEEKEIEILKVGHRQSVYKK